MLCITGTLALIWKCASNTQHVIYIRDINKSQSRQVSKCFLAQLELTFSKLTIDK